MNEPLPKLGRLALVSEISKLAVAASTPEVPNHAILARAEKLVEWMRAGCPPKPPKGAKVEGTTTVASADVEAVFRHWCVIMKKNGGTKLTPDRVRLISARLKEGATVDHCKLAIDGCKNSPHHMGKNKEGTVYNSIELIFRSGDKLDDFAQKAPKYAQERAVRPPPPKKPTEAPVDEETARKFAAELRAKLGTSGGRGMASVGSMLPKGPMGSLLATVGEDDGFGQDYYLRDAGGGIPGDR